MNKSLRDQFQKTRAVIIGGASIQNENRIRALLRADDFFIYCDSGLYHLDLIGAEPDLIIGDFDSHPQPDLMDEPAIDDPRQAAGEEAFVEPAPYGQTIRHARTPEGTELIILPHMKDWTDTFYAAKIAAERGFEEVLLLGASGGRPDLYFANISILNMLEMQGITACMADDWSEMRLLIAAKSLPARIPDSCRYFSLLAYDGPAEDVTVRGALYPLERAVITADNPYAVSNEVLPGERAEVVVGRGKLLLVVVV